MKLPFSHFSITQEGQNAVSKAWQIDISLGENRIAKFFALIILNKGPENNDSVIDELSSRMIETINYQQKLLEGNKISITSEDFFEQCLQKINAELSNFLRDISSALPVHSWAIAIGMLAPDSKPKRVQFFTSRFGEVSGWLLNNAQLETKKLINVFDEPDTLPQTQIPQKFFRNILASSLPSNDQLFFCTPNLLNYISLSDIKKTLSTLNAPASLKHFENQIDFGPNDVLVSAITIKLSEHPILEDSPNMVEKASAENSMSSLINTQDETEKLLGNSMGLGLGRFASSFKSLADNLKNKALPSNSEVVPSQGGGHKNTTLNKVVSVLIGWLAFAYNSLVSIVSKIRKEPTGASRKNKKLQLLSTNKTITKVNIWKQKIKTGLSPITKKAQNVRWAGIFKKPATYIVIAVVIAIFVITSTIRSSVKEKADDFASAEAVLTTISENITRIDAHLIVGRENDAVTLLQQSHSMLESISSYSELEEDSDKLKSQLEERQRRIRKEILIQNPVSLVSDLSAKLTTPPKSIIVTDNGIHVIGENPRFMTKLRENNTSEVIEISTDANAFTSAQAIDASTLLLLNNNSVTVVDLDEKTAISTVANTQSSIIGAEFFNNRLYTISPEENQVLKSNLAPNYSVLTNWITDSAADVSNAIDLAIDGSIYVLSPTSLTQFIRGKLANPGISLDALDPPLSDAKKLHLTEDNNKIYILEPSRLIVFEKTGRFVAQYVLDNNGTIKDFAIDNAGNKGYILTENELKSFELE